MLKKMLWLGLGAFMAMLLIVGGLIGGKISEDGSNVKLAILQVFASPVEPSLASTTMVLEDNLYICGNIEELSKKPLSAYNISTEKEIREKFSGPGISVDIRQDEILVQRKINDFCSYHKDFRHLGIYDNKLAIYQGPVGYNQKLIKVEQNLPLEKLSASFQVKLQQSMNFFQMTPETQANIRYELEFSNEDRLNAVLENLDEMH
ncbi:BofC C-terminal domain-containing protein [Desulforamulus aquiferis]|uniref:BofC C-terminal domain-containing protein n=1 Tax=Desulforamulus aquiferis TaxID=1397668 RepID=A0AAW7ZHL2_9FIRM|nr:BofC C-terminal domain-containing protein [Desulforamulus aquiferis]MDO7788868.1 BofC C-terminal domain-containing protein [Desulforamulus aquiferis]RYD06402.1 hypothetical protein N752_04365 [Desulforamulus aquiferis]